MADREDDIRNAQSEYSAALAVIQKSAATGCPGKAGRGQEARYGQAYQRLVLLGLKPQLNGKYRG